MQQLLSGGGAVDERNTGQKLTAQLSSLGGLHLCGLVILVDSHLFSHTHGARNKKQPFIRSVLNPPFCPLPCGVETNAPATARGSAALFLIDRVRGMNLQSNPIFEKTLEPAMTAVVALLPWTSTPHKPPT